MSDYSYLKGQEREKYVIDRHIASPYSATAQMIFENLRIPYPFIWMGVRLAKQVLFGDVDPSGDIDLILGPLEIDASREEIIGISKDYFNLPKYYQTQATFEHFAKVEKIKWPPDFSFIHAIECKAPYMNEKGILKRTGSGSIQSIKGQAKDCCKRGLNRTTLLFLITTAPVHSPGYHDWMIAGTMSGEAQWQLKDEFKNSFSTDDPFGSLIISVGHVAGHKEKNAGSITWNSLNDTPDNPMLDLIESQKMRRELEQRLNKITKVLPFPKLPPIYFPILIMQCSSLGCNNIFFAAEAEGATCPKCSSPAR